MLPLLLPGEDAKKYCCTFADELDDDKTGACELVAKALLNKLVCCLVEARFWICNEFILLLLLLALLLFP